MDWCDCHLFTDIHFRLSLSSGQQSLHVTCYLQPRQSLHVTCCLQPRQSLHVTCCLQPRQSLHVTCCLQPRQSLLVMCCLQPRQSQSRQSQSIAPTVIQQSVGHLHVCFSRPPGLATVGLLPCARSLLQCRVL